MISGESGLARYLNQIRRFPMLEPQEEYMLAKRWREHEDPDAAHKLVTSHLQARRQDRDGLPRLWPADQRSGLGRQCRPHAGRQTLRARQRLSPRDLCDVVDPRLNSRIYSAFLVARENGNDGEPKEAFLQFAPREKPDFGAGRRRHAPRPSQNHRPPARRQRTGRHRHEPADVGRRLAQYAAARGERRRMAGLACR